MVAVEEGDELGASQRRQRSDLRIDPRLEEKGNRVALAAIADHAVLCRLDAPTRPKLEQLTEVDDEAVLDRWNIDPYAPGGPRLQAFNAVLRQKRHESGIHMGPADHLAPPAVMRHP